MVRSVLSFPLALLSQLLQGALSTFLETAKELAKEQQRADEAKTTERIDGRKDVQELVERNAARVRQRGAVGEASAMFAAGLKCFRALNLIYRRVHEKNRALHARNVCNVKIWVFRAVLVRR